eukprot:CAMPEP_0201589530 /NCGR_PEP_ID=MMETSP0190_2-20130828/167597_1 /ASSEMBLY_ACC=CAM_ASM_000263 /TAXON_ID=37353 /ORGANISM="Rosalina sp." /LENGTH=84 /DNA_ID=CAMNT_0048043835 /DNA_START=26 /DNA_END=277 /DNA_ORIENTATION=+
MDVPMLPDEPSHDPDTSDDDAPIGPFAQRSVNQVKRQTIGQHGDLPHLPDEDMDTDDGTDTDTEDGNREMYGSYVSPGGDIEMQ